MKPTTWTPNFGGIEFTVRRLFVVPGIPGNVKLFLVPRQSRGFT
jgi:hypothetical protein